MRYRILSLELYGTPVDVIKRCIKREPVIKAVPLRTNLIIFRLVRRGLTRVVECSAEWPIRSARSKTRSKSRIHHQILRHLVTRCQQVGEWIRISVLRRTDVWCGRTIREYG